MFLDGGGMKGLVQIEALVQLEEATGRRITELFDWIIGTSTGGIVALALVYGTTLYSIYVELAWCIVVIHCTIHGRTPCAIDFSWGFWYCT